MQNLKKSIVIALLTWGGSSAVGCTVSRGADDCGNIAYYGPQPCASDDQCAADHGEGWVCDEDHTVGSGECARTWPICVPPAEPVPEPEPEPEPEPNPCGDIAYYGPPPCTSDDQCATDHGEGWVCDEDHTVGSGECAQTWPICVPPAEPVPEPEPEPEPCGDVAYYGPQPCTSDEQCVEEHGAGWVCDEDNTVGEGECAVVWPMCVPSDDGIIAYYGPMPCVGDSCGGDPDDDEGWVE